MPSAVKNSCSAPNGYGDQVADGLQSVLVGNGLGHSDAVGVVNAQLIEHIHLILILHLLLGIVVKGLAFGYIAGVLLEEGSENGAVIGIHDIAAGFLPGELPEHIHSGHLVLDGHFGVGFVLDQDFHHLVDQLHFGIDSVIRMADRTMGRIRFISKSLHRVGAGMGQLCIQQVVFNQKFPCDFFHGAAFHIHGIGHIGHFFVVHGATEQSKDLPEIRSHILHLFKQPFPHQQ